MPDSTVLSEAQLQRLQGWRRGVVGLWLATMAVAIAVWVVATVFATSFLVDLGLVCLLLALAAAGVWNMRRGTCPRCGQRIRFEPRIELPSTCSRCHTSFLPAAEE